MTTGIVIAILLLLLLGNCILKKAGSVKFRQFAGKAHKVVGIVFIAAAVVHLILTLPLFKQRPIAMYILGISMLVFAIIEFALFLLRKKWQKGWLKAHRICAVLMLCCLIGHIFFGLTSLVAYQKDVAAIKVKDVDLTKVKDGTYEGICDVQYVYAKVKVKVENHKIVSVDLLEHRTERGQKAEVLPERIVKEQKVSVDAVSGATNSSRVIEQAVCNALTGR